MLNQLSASIVDGLLIGFVYGIAAMGLTLIWGVMRVINLAHGATMALGMFCTYFLFSDLAVNPYLGLVALGSLVLKAGTCWRGDCRDRRDLSLFQMGLHTIEQQCA